MLNKIVKQGHPECPPMYLQLFFFSLSNSNNYISPPPHILLLRCLSKLLPAFPCPPHSLFFFKVLLLHVSFSVIHGNKYLLLWSIQKVCEEGKTDVVI